MATIKLSELGETYSLGSNDLIYAVKDDTSYKITKANVLSDVYSMVGDLTTLTTTDKTSIVSAINELIPVVLFNGTPSTSSVNLSDSVDNYAYIEIFYGWSGMSFGYSSTKVYEANGKIANLGQIVHANSNLYVASSYWTVNTNTLTNSSSEYWRWAANGAPSRTQTNQIQVVKVIGYKQ